MYCIPFNYIQLDPLCLINRYLFNIWWYNACIRVRVYYTLTTGYFLLCWNVKIQFDVTLQNTQQYHRFVTKLRTYDSFIRIDRYASIYLKQSAILVFYKVLFKYEFVKCRGRQISRISSRKDIALRDAFDFFLYSIYIYTMKRKLWSMVLVSFFHVHRDFLSPNEIFSLWRNKIRDLLSRNISPEEEVYFESNGTFHFNLLIPRTIVALTIFELEEVFYQWISIEEIENCVFLFLIIVEK